MSELDPKVLAAAWGAWRVRHPTSSMGPGPGFREAIAAAAPPAPTPEAGSSTGAGWTTPHKGPVAKETEAAARRIAARRAGGAYCDADAVSEDAWRSEIHAAEAALWSASPPPGEDLAGQGEPVAWVWEYQLSGGEWIKAVGPSEPCSSEYIRNIRPLYAAPAPSRPADREEIARVIAAAYGFGHPLGLDCSDGREYWRTFKMRHLKEADAVLAFLALRDAPRNGGAGTQDTQGDGT